MASTDALFRPFTLKGVTFRNRVLSTSHAPAYGEDGLPGERYQLYHEAKAKGGIALTMFGGSASVAIDSPATPWRQLDLSSDRIVPHFQVFAERIHRHGAKLMCQLTHMGRRTRWDIDNWIVPISASAVREAAHRSFPKAMEDHDIRRVVKAYGEAAARCRAGGLDGCEVLYVSHLIGQFLSPRVNRRNDDHGGSLANRMRFGLEVLEAVRKAVGGEFIVGIRATADELVEGGMDERECLEMFRTIARTGLVDYFNVNAGDVFNHMELANSIPNMAYPEAPYLYLASAVKQATGLPVLHGGRIASVELAARAIEEGHVDMVAMTRAHIADPYLMAKLAANRADDIRQCVGASYCLDRIYLGGEALCIQNAATGREQTMPHVIARGEGPRRRVVVVGAGPAGLEAARVSAARGHDVVLIERESSVGGQIALAARVGWRQSLSGITRWLESQVLKLGVEVRLGVTADAALVEGERPDIVIIATGGAPNKSFLKGAQHALTTWDVLSGAVPPAENVLLYDDQGDHQAASCAEFMARQGALVEIVTPGRALGEELGSTNFAVHLRELHLSGVVITPDQRLIEVYPEGNRRIAVLRNEYTLEEEERAVDQVVVEHGTLPNDALYFALKAGSRNLGEIDIEALVAGQAQAITTNPQGRFQLFRVGDAVASRNIHAAIYDSLRLCCRF